MTRSLLKQEAKKQLSKNLGVLILSGLILGIVVSLPNAIQGYNTGVIMASLNSMPKSVSPMDTLMQLYMSPPLIMSSLISFIFSPVLALGVHHVYLKAMNDEKPSLSEMFSKMSQFGTALVTNILMGIFVFLQFLLLIVPGIIASYSYAMTYFVLAEHPDFSPMEAIKESKRIMKGHRFELFVLQLSFFWWYLLVAVTFGLAALYVIPYTEIAKANFYNKIKNA